MAQYKLHCFCQSGNSYKAALYLNCAGLDWEPVFVDFFKGATREPEWRQGVNEMGEAPVLETQGKKLTQSGVILTYLAQKSGKFAPANEDAKLEALRWILFDNHKFTSYFGTYRFMKSFAATPPDPAVMAFLKGRIDAAYGVVDKHLAEREFLVGPGPTIADFSLSGYVFYPESESGLDLKSRFPSVAAWVERLKRVPGWADPYEVLPGAKIAPKW